MLISIIFIALALAMDSFAVSISCGACMEDRQIRDFLRVSLTFGAFHVFMPILGWIMGKQLQNYVAGVDHWIAFAILIFVGSKMIWEAYQLDEECPTGITNRRLILLSLAVSLDALAVGISLPFLKFFIITPALIIGLVTFALSITGIYIGDRIGHLFERKFEILGGVILILIGIKIVVQHIDII